MSKGTLILVFFLTFFVCSIRTEADELSVVINQLNTSRHVLLQRESRLEDEKARLEQEKAFLYSSRNSINQRINVIEMRMSEIDSSLARTESKVVHVEVALNSLGK